MNEVAVRDRSVVELIDRWNRVVSLRPISLQAVETAVGEAPGLVFEDKDPVRSFGTNLVAVFRPDRSIVSVSMLCSPSAFQRPARIAPSATTEIMLWGKPLIGSAGEWSRHILALARRFDTATVGHDRYELLFGDCILRFRAESPEAPPDRSTLVQLEFFPKGEPDRHPPIVSLVRAPGTVPNQDGR